MLDGEVAERLCWGGGTSANLGNRVIVGTTSGWEASNAVRDTAEISSSARWRRIAIGAPASPQLATREHVEKRHQRDETEHGPCQLRAAADIPAGGKVNPHQDHGNGMEEADQEFKDLLHCLNLPGPLRVPVRFLPAAPKPPPSASAARCVSWLPRCLPDDQLPPREQAGDAGAGKGLGWPHPGMST